MALDDTTRRGLEERFGAAEWPRGRQEKRHDLSPFPFDGELAGWRPLRIWPVPWPGASRAFQGLWRSDEPPDALLRTDTVAMGGSRAGQELLLELLGEFESPLLARVDEGGPGDVAFTMPGGTAVLFARDNVVVMVRNAERAVVVVTSFALALDQMLSAEAPPTDS